MLVESSSNLVALANFTLEVQLLSAEPYDTLHVVLTVFTSNDEKLHRILTVAVDVSLCI
jgi:hypothetical protein